jgi:DNA-binding transcriptional LysR family regulator
MAHNEPKQMVSAIALAEELSFTQAAIKLRVSQPTLTRNIASLEEELGVELFERDHTKVRLNDAGRAYVEEARIAVLHSARAVQAARAAKQNSEVVLNIGKTPYADPFLLSTLLSIRLPLHPHLRTEVSSQFSYELAHEVLRGALDLAIIVEPPESALLTKVKIDEAPFYIAMSEEDELAQRQSVTLDELAGRWWVLFERRMHPPVYDSVLQLAGERKVRPSKIQHAVIPEEAFPLIANGTCIAFVVKSGALRVARNGVTVRPLMESSLMLKTYLASHAEDSSKVVSELVRAFMRKLASFSRPKASTLPAQRETMPSTQPTLFDDLNVDLA